MALFPGSANPDLQRPVLVVGTDATARAACATAVESAGWPVVSAASCEDALGIVDAIECRAVLVDIVDGADWYHCRFLCSRVNHAPVVVLSARWTPDRWYRAMAERMGCSGFIAKPCAPGVVLDVLRRACAGHRWVEHVADSGVIVR